LDGWLSEPQVDVIRVAEDDEMSGIFHHPEAAPAHRSKESVTSDQSFDIANPSANDTTVERRLRGEHLSHPFLGCNRQRQFPHLAPPAIEAVMTRLTGG
jgi:hypothetical protein